MTEKELDDWARSRRVLYHVTARHSWLSIKKYGLLSTNALLKASGLSESERCRIGFGHRDHSEPVRGSASCNPQLKAVIRDQTPLSDSRLKTELKEQKACISAEEWYERQNARVFFYPSKTEAVELASSYAKNGCPQDILVFRAESLVETHRPDIRLCAFNSGTSNREKPVPEDCFGKWHDHLFRTVSEYPYAHWKRKYSRSRAIREITILHGIPEPRRQVIEILRTDDGKDFTSIPL